MSSIQPNILVFTPDKKDAEAYADCIRNFGFTSVKAAATLEEAEKNLPQTEIILGWKFPTYILNQPISSNIRWFQSMGAGVDDLVADQSIPESIQLTRIVDQFGTYISEYVFTYLLHIVKDVSRMSQSQMERNWDPFISESLAGKTIGVAGLGSIGAEIVRKARVFDMNVHGLSFSRKQASLVDRHYTSNSWADFVKDLDYLVTILPLTEATHHIINEKLLLAMKPDACLVNVGRGALIDEGDLLSVMKTGHLRAAVLDVFEKEPLPNDHAFWSMPNVYVTSHLSGPSTIDGVCSFFAENLKRFMNGQPLHGLVDRERRY
ncbi:D-2-hydroxyacid dehydrogenase [Bacillus sp. DTU_2020_1000418_1_SI_GHA_SEK_038]|uniref:D-2-hydroxyacid dehydrogenase n=1 Tax=Bacillus sp. DTU_2020_1000418_1_SI_GHA_SEK_038 TaxID=3077585 RepID=UPI0028EC4466|nr:D-2-hydroxyacid dehydrogenase [Bacillus sp. DTU_2020_1000418_1_SI_GHA_SEK_038]WNS75798.1 D-2-hydroxyacid dehydrogenase [Bacillus sp. DTU_2020_1000418_1_SI_GHA_SEK_038]